MLEIKLDQAALESFCKPEWRREIPFVMSHAINRTLIASRKEQQKAMGKHIDGGPNRWTKDGIRYLSSTKQDLHGVLYYKADRPYMHTIIDGGTVVAKKKKLSQPVNVRTDKFGNIPSGGGKNKYTARAKKNPKFFLGIPKGRTGEQFRGVWRRYGKGGLSKRGKARGRIKLMVSWMRERRYQNKSFPAYDVVKAHAPRYLDRQLAISFRKALRTSRNRRRPTGF